MHPHLRSVSLSLDGKANSTMQENSTRYSRHQTHAPPELTVPYIYKEPSALFLACCTTAIMLAASQKSESQGVHIWAGLRMFVCLFA
jgi:hypothetical protein